MRKHILPLLLLVAAVWFLYFQTGSFEFLRLDDHDYTFRCAFVKDGLSVGNVLEALSNPRHAAIWMPVTYISYMADISLFGPGMGPHHLVNVFIHTLNAILLYFLLLSLLSPRPPPSPTPRADSNIQIFPHSNILPTCFAFFAATFWAIHPQRAEAVAWIAGRKELLCAFFTLLGLLCWIRPGRLAQFATYACCALACMSKPTAMCFPFLAFAFKWIDSSSRSPTLRHPHPPVQTFKHSLIQTFPYLPLLAMAIATGALAIFSQTHPEGRAELALFSASLPWRLLNALSSIGLYLFQAMLPVGIHLDYRATPGQFPLDGVLGLFTLLIVACILVGCSLLAIRWHGRDGARPSPLGLPAFKHSNIQTLLSLFLFFLAALGPTLGIFGSFGEHARADRFLYLPAIAFSLGIASLLQNLAVRLGRDGARPSRWIVLGVPLIVGYFCASFPVVAAYQNDYTVFSRTLQFDPENGRALAHVASEECARFGHLDKGITLYRRSQELRPRDDTASQLAYTLALRGLSSDTAEIRRLCAKFACDHTLDRKGMALEALGVTAMRQRKWPEAISCLEDSIKAPQRFYSAEDAQLRLGACYNNAKRPKDALRVLEPLTQSRRTDIAERARQFLGMVKKNSNSVLLF